MIAVDSVKNFVESSEVAKSFFEHLAGRKKSYRVTTVERAMAITGYGRKDVVDLFKQMTEQGMGDFIVGRRTGVSRFEWAMPMVDVAKAAFGELELNEIEPLHGDELDELEVEETEEEAEVESTGLVKHSFSLRPRSAAVVFYLPEDLTGREAQRLANFMLTLPVEPLEQ